MAQDDFAQDFDLIFGGIGRRARSDRYAPNVDLYVNADHSMVIVHVEISGADQSSLNVEADDRLLYISGQRSSKQPSHAPTYLLKEIEYGEFERRVGLPFAVDHDAANAHYEDGILTIELPARKSEVPTILRTEIRLIFRRTTP